MQSKQLSLVACFGLLFVASTSFSQMYTITDLGPNGPGYSQPSGMNSSGQVVGTWGTSFSEERGFRTAPHSPINPDTDDLGSLGGPWTVPLSINRSGEVVGIATLRDGTSHPFRTAPNSPINPDTDDMSLPNYMVDVTAINDAGQVIGRSSTVFPPYHYAFRTAPNKPFNPATDNLGALGVSSDAYGINSSGQVVGTSYFPETTTSRSFRTAPNSPIDPATDDIGTLGGSWTVAAAINNLGQVVGTSDAGGVLEWHAFRTAPNKPINPATDDLGTLGSISSATSVDSFGQVVGNSSLDDNGAADFHAFIYSGDAMYDLNKLIPENSGWIITYAVGINDAGEIAVGAVDSIGSVYHALVLSPIFRTLVQAPIRADGSSVFQATRGTVPVKFTLTQLGAPTCTLLPARIAVARVAEGALAALDGSVYSAAADSGSQFRIDGCQYVYNLAASSLGVGTYRVDISINGIFVGHAVFGLK